MNAGDDALESFGGFSLGSLQLALPMSALREVMPCTELADLPCPAPCVIGAIGVRGVLVPVVDLRIALGREAPGSEVRNVVLMVHGGRVLGLLADGVTGIFDVPRQRTRPDAANDAAAAAIFSAGAIRADNRVAVSLLSPEVLSRLHQVPMVDDPEPERQRVLVDAQDREVIDASVPMMLLRCGDVLLAVEAMLVHATLSDPALEPSALSGEHCRGVIDYGAAKVPAVDLQSLCGLGRLDPAGGAQAFIVSLPAGQVAFLISGVVDVVRTLPDDVKRVPAFALPRPRLFAGALPLSALPADVVERTGGAAGQYLVISSAGLTACDEVAALSGMNTFAATAAAGASGARAVEVTGRVVSNRRSMITYLLQGERASPLEQVTEILRYEPQRDMLPPDGPLLGLMMNRGRVIPVVCLGRAAGEACHPPTPESSVLVVESEGELIGFAVAALGTIDQAEWEPTVRGFNGGESTPERSTASASRPLALLGTGDAERMLELIDLHRLARAFQAQAALAA